MQVRNRKKHKKKETRRAVSGLERLNSQPLPPRGIKQQKDTKSKERDIYEPGTVLGDFFYLAKKTGGVEPGFFAVEINEDFVRRFNQIFDSHWTDAEACLLYLDTLKEMEFGDYQEHINILVQQLCVDARKGKLPEGHVKLDLLLFKQDYDEPGLRGVKPDDENLGQTQAVKKQPLFIQSFYTKVYGIARTRSPSEENINAILECLGTAFARAYGMQAQDQQLIIGSYANGHPKVMTVCVWDPELEALENCEEGSLRKEDYENYLVLMKRDEKTGEVVKIKSRSGKYFISDNTLEDLGESLALFCLHGDNDLYGSHMQNKGKKRGRIYGYDFGHAFRLINLILQPNQNLQDDFTFTQPSKSSKKFKNLSVCYDTEISARMSGLFFLYKMMEQHLKDRYYTQQGQENIEVSINLYKEKYPNFSKRYEEVEPECMEKLLYDYYFKFIELAIKEDSALTSYEYLTYASKIQESAQQALSDANKLFGIFKTKMQLSPLEVELLYNLEKLTSETSLTSQNGEVILSHLRIIPHKKIAWKIAVNEDLSLYLEADLSGRDAEKKFNFLREFFSRYNTREDIKLDFQNGVARIYLPHDPIEMNVALQHLHGILDEKNIITFKHDKKLIPTEILYEHPEHAKLLGPYSSEFDQEREDISKEKSEKLDEKEKEDKKVLTQRPECTFFSSSRKSSSESEDYSGKHQNVIVGFNRGQLSEIIEPLVFYLTERLNPSKQNMVDKEKSEGKIAATKQCLSSILASNMSHLEIYEHLAVLQRYDYSVDGTKSNKLKSALQSTMSRMEFYFQRDAKKMVM